MATESAIHDVIGIQWKGPRKLEGRTTWVLDLFIYDQDSKRPHQVTLFARTAQALVPMRDGEVEHVE